MKLVGWTGAYTSNLPTTSFSESRKEALVECIKRRHYNFTHFNHEFLDYCCPVYEDMKICILTKPQFDEVIAEAYAEMKLGTRLMPIDAIKRSPIDGVLYEKKDYEPKEGENNV